MGRAIVILICISIISCTARADGNLMFEQANALYHSKNYDSAAKLYTQLVQNGYCSDDLYYNMGNAFYRSKKIGWAIWSYRKSMDIECDKYALDNYKLAKGQIKNPLLEQNEIFFLRWWRSVYSLFTVNGWAIFALSSFVVYLILTYLSLFRKKRINLGIRYTFLALFLSSFFFMFIKYYNNVNHYEAVLVDAAYFNQIGLKDREKVPEGSEIRILDKEPKGKKGQVLVKLSDLREGFIPKQAVKRL